jgi:hypothetical protein
MWIDKDGRCFPEMQHFSEMLKKSNVIEKEIIWLCTRKIKIIEIRLLQFDWRVNPAACNVQGSLDKREFGVQKKGAGNTRIQVHEGRAWSMGRGGAGGAHEESKWFRWWFPRCEAEAGRKFRLSVSVSSLFDDTEGEDLDVYAGGEMG